MHTHTHTHTRTHTHTYTHIHTHTHTHHTHTTHTHTHTRECRERVRTLFWKRKRVEDRERERERERERDRHSTDLDLSLGALGSIAARQDILVQPVLWRAPHHATPYRPPQLVYQHNIIIVQALQASLLFCHRARICQKSLCQREKTHVEDMMRNLVGLISIARHIHLRVPAYSLDVCRYTPRPIILQHISSASSMLFPPHCRRCPL